MKYRYTVKKDGVLYPAGTEVPAGEHIGVELTNDVPDGALDTNPDGSVNAYDENGNVVGKVDAETVKELQEQAGKQFSKSEISRMSTADLKTLAPTLGIEVTEESTGAKLKEEIIAKLGL